MAPLNVSSIYVNKCLKFAFLLFLHLFLPFSCINLDHTKKTEEVINSFTVP